MSSLKHQTILLSWLGITCLCCLLWPASGLADGYNYGSQKLYSQQPAAMGDDVLIAFSRETATLKELNALIERLKRESLQFVNFGYMEGKDETYVHCRKVALYEKDKVKAGIQSLLDYFVDSEFNFR
jgi:hypothetical protein